MTFQPSTMQIHASQMSTRAFPILRYVQDIFAKDQSSSPPQVWPVAWEHVVAQKGMSPVYNLHTFALESAMVEVLGLVDAGIACVAPE